MHIERSNTSNASILEHLTCRDGRLPTTLDYKQVEKFTLGERMAGSFPLVVPDSFMIIAHRGASGYSADQTAESFLRAKALGAGHVEIDAQVAADGVVVLCHDEHLKHYGYEGEIKALSYEDVLSRCDMGVWRGFGRQEQNMLCLEDLFLRHGRDFVFHIELKSNQPELPEAVIDLVRKHGLRDQVVLTSQWINLLDAARKIDESLPRAFLCRYLDQAMLEQAKNVGCSQVCPRADLLSPEIVGIVKDNGMDVRAWGVSWLSDDPAVTLWRTSRVIQSGCVGTTINEPDFLIHARVAARQKHEIWPVTLDMYPSGKTMSA
ncbi:MAG: glycerophosphodiester phosphodiesterase [Deltaproteobacteria bacterium]|nr:glycerophosphodiester phosphodiesterase [Deltaproteobacteria bacterium]